MLLLVPPVPSVFSTPEKEEVEEGGVLPLSHGTAGSGFQNPRTDSAPEYGLRRVSDQVEAYVAS